MSPLTTISNRYAELPDKEYQRLVRYMKTRQTESAKSSGLQLLGGIALGCVAGSLGGPIAGVIAGGAIVAMPILKALEQGAIDDEVEEFGVLAPYLQGKELDRYQSIVGADQVVAEIALAQEEMSNRITKDAQSLIKTDQYQAAVSQAVQSTAQQLSQAAVSQVLPISESTQTAPQTAPASLTSRYEIDVAAFMAKHLRPSLISAKQRTGKGVTIAQFMRLIQSQGIQVWVVQPKAVTEELGYWQTADRFLGCYLSTMEDKAQFTQEFMQLVREYRVAATKENPIVLIVDECVLIESELPKWYKDDFVSFVKSEISSGETTGRFLYLISQSPQVGDLKISGGNRSNFNLLTLQTPDSSEHWASIKASYKGVFPDIPTGLHHYSNSPKGAIAITNAVPSPSWCTVPKYPVYEFDEATACPDVKAAIAAGRVHGMSSSNTATSAWEVIEASPVNPVEAVLLEQLNEADAAYIAVRQNVLQQLAASQDAVKLTDVTSDNERRKYRDRLLNDLRASGYCIEEKAVNGSAIKSILISHEEAA